MTRVDLVNGSYSSTKITENKTKKVLQKDDNIFATSVRNIGMDGLANFLSNDWSANTARKAGFNDFANWLDNKTADGKELNDDGFFSNLAREAIKHPVITIATIATTVFLGKNIANALKKSVNSVNKAAASTAATTTSATAVATAKTAPKANLTPHQLQEIIEEGLAYEQKIDFSNLEIFRDVSPEAKRKVLNHYQYPYHQTRFLKFASGSTPGLLEKSVIDDIFDGLRSPTVKVVEAFDREAGTLILNKNAAEKIIQSNRALFAHRLGLAETASVNEIFDLVSKSSGSPIASSKSFSDLRHLLIGTTKENATISQLIQDATLAEKHKRFNVGFVSFYEKSAVGLESFKQALRDSLKSSSSSYSTMPQSFKDEILKIIDSITLEEYGRRLGDSSRFFQGGKYKTQNYEALKKLATKLEEARKFGTSISMS